ncbi:hypothetical protein ACVMGC_010414 [Bradyrhizobium barranii subsp. barranii]
MMVLLSDAPTSAGVISPASADAAKTCSSAPFVCSNVKPAFRSSVADFMMPVAPPASNRPAKSCDIFESSRRCSFVASPNASTMLPALANSAASLIMFAPNHAAGVVTPSVALRPCRCITAMRFEVSARCLFTAANGAFIFAAMPASEAPRLLTWVFAALTAALRLGLTLPPMLTNTEKPVAMLLCLHRLVDVGLKLRGVFKPAVEIVEGHFLDFRDRDAAFGQPNERQNPLSEIA